jgi:hypothetical protein
MTKHIGHATTAMLFGAVVMAFGQQRASLRDIRQIDFRDFQLPWASVTVQGFPQFRWLTGFDATVRLQDGAHTFGSLDECGRSCPRLVLTSIQYVYVNGDAVADAIITLTYETGGTGHWEYVYLYSVENGSPKLLAAFQTGSRIGHGLHRVYVGNGDLIIELNEPDENKGECCATWRTRTEYRWHNDHFEAVSEPVKEQIPVHERTWYVSR